jgi:lipoprotein-anchoring transpeptidase ErfK/SrfK
VSRRRRRGRGRRIPTGLLLLVGVLGSAWWVYRVENSSAKLDSSLLLAPQTAAIWQPETEPTAAPTPSPIPSSAAPSAPVVEEKQPGLSRAAALLAAGREALQRNDELTARTNLSAALQLGVSGTDEEFLRTELTRLGTETVLSTRIVNGDPLVDRYVIQTGDVLAKIAAANKVTPDLLASVNGIVDKHRIREGQTIKIVKGPFRAVLSKRTYTLDIYLADTFVRNFKVGLGADDSTPTGEWRIATKLMNPTYYPPRGGEIIATDDPKNPLGERWIGLVGISGAAVAQERYGIHGTNEPDSIGKSVSMGCIRMHNEDVEVLYTYLVETHSTVTVRD